MKLIEYWEEIVENVLTYVGTCDDEAELVFGEIFTYLSQSLYGGVICAREVLGIKYYGLGWLFVDSMLHDLVLDVLHSRELKALIRLDDQSFSVHGYRIIGADF